MADYSEREKLVVLIMEAERYAQTFNRYWAGVIAERLLASGVVVPKHGRWVGYQCSVCGGSSEYGSENYCPNCGAKMDLE